MKVSCALPREIATPDFIAQLEDLGVQPIITDYVVRAVYEGDNRSFGEAIIDAFSRQPDHEITAYYTEKELGAFARDASDRKRRSSRRKKNQS